MVKLATPLIANSPKETSELFEEAVAQDLDAVMTLFEPNTSSATSATESISGLGAIRENLGGYIALRPTMKLTPTQVITADDLAQVVGDWTMEGTDPEGKPISMNGRYVDVVRRQPNGRWLFIIDNAWLG